MADQAPAAKPKFYQVRLARSVRFQDVQLSPKDTLSSVSEEALAELGDAVLEAIELPDGAQV